MSPRSAGARRLGYMAANPSRKLIPAGRTFPTRVWGCDQCKWQLPTPKRGPFAHTTPRAIMAQVRIGFNSHGCANNA